MTFDPFADYSGQVDAALAGSGQRHDFFLDAKVRLIERTIEHQLAGASRSRILEIGSGPGLLQQRFHLPVWGLEPSLGCVSAARRRHAGRGQIAGDGRRSPFPAGSFDVVLAVCVLHHVPPPDREQFVGEMARLTRPGGLVVICEHNPWNPLTRRVVARCSFDEGVTLLASSYTRALLRASGLGAIATRFILFFPWRGALWQSAERLLGMVPLGGQYVCFARGGA
jgi:SAM-dependent methyltransferase